MALLIEPIEEEEDVLGVVGRDHVRVNVLVKEVAMVRQPADGKECYYDDKHFDHLKR